MDGTPKGITKASLANWTGLAYKIPRTELDKVKDIDYLKQSGVYFLFGTSDDTQENFVYIGQAGIRKNGEGILNRLQEHRRNPEKDYWTEAVALTTSNNAFGPTEISYLENQFTKIATDSKRYTLKNGNEPSQGHVTEEKQSELEDFIDYSKLVIGALGYRVFEPLIEETNIQTPIADNQEDELLLFLTRKTKTKSNVIIKASAKQTSEGIVLLEGSEIEAVDSKTIPEKIKNMRRKPGRVVDGKLTENLLFSSPSYAASFVVGGNVNGKEYWKDQSGRTLKEIETLSN
jgi:hypothetical protein